MIYLLPVAAMRVCVITFYLL